MGAIGISQTQDLAAPSMTKISLLPTCASLAEPSPILPTPVSMTQTRAMLLATIAVGIRLMGGADFMIRRPSKLQETAAPALTLSQFQ